MLELLNAYRSENRSLLGTSPKAAPNSGSPSSCSKPVCIPLKQVLTTCEVAWRFVEAERLKLLEGKSTLTAENIGTLMRSQEKALELAKGFLGETLTPEDLSKAEKQNDRLEQARRALEDIEARERLLQAQGVTPEG
jgi:hypothetical protein